MDIIDSLKSMLFHWPIGTIVCSIFILLALMLIALVLWELFVAIDSWFLKKLQGTGKIISKDFTPSYTQISSINEGQTPHIIHYSDDWSVNIEIDGKCDDLSVTEKYYNSISEGSLVTVRYVFGRLSGNLHIKEIVKD